MTGISSITPFSYSSQSDTDRGIYTLYKALEQLKKQPNPRDCTEFINTLKTLQNKIPSKQYEDLYKNSFSVALEISTRASS